MHVAPPESLYELGAATARIGTHDTAYPHRGAPYLFSIVSLWDHPTANASEYTAWTQSFWREVRPHTAGAHVNFLGAERDERVRDAYGAARYERLARVKAELDPTNLFRLNHNMEPAA